MAARKGTTRWTTVYGTPRVRLGLREVPQAVELRTEPRDSGPGIYVRAEVRHGVPDITALHLTASPDGRGLRTSDLLDWNLENLALNVLMYSEWSEPSEDEWWAANKAGDARAQARAKARKPTSADLQQVANIYRAAFSSRPTQAVARAFGFSHRTAARRVADARTAGLLPLTTPGKKLMDGESQ